MSSLLKRISRKLRGQNDKVVDRDAWIAQYTPGLTFADVGGLWGTVNEKVSVAALAGAAATTMVDIQPLGSKWWQLFDARCRGLEVAGYTSVCADVCKPGVAKTLGRFDVVHCSGIMYHVPDVLGFLRNLYRLSGRYLILNSMIIPEVISNDCGTLRLPQGAVMSVPSMSADARAILSRHFTALDISIKDITCAAPQYVTEKMQFRTGPWWWLYSPETMKALVQVLPFTVMDEGYSVLHKTYSLLLRVDESARPDIAANGFYGQVRES